ncbi:MAG: alpha-N-acetylglucosaminidase C-terminal domain-containing protein, partial [Muribaculaceae bacterium]|nr:alpha-N-acetylglucosaminidase C-terminal domain-containing protein [Muribaculaceae bacterium]
AVWQKVWMKMGMTAEETRNYFTGPSYLPWHRMANIDHWCGPLPQEWLDDQVELQKQILARERALNMRPVLPAFAGHVPRRIKELYPDADIKMLEPWNYFPEECYTFFMNSEDPLFAKIQKAFIEEQTALFGTDHIYGFDPFNEVDPPVWEPKYINRVTKHMYQSLAKVDKKAEWLLMGWFYYFNKNWTTERVKAMMDAVPRGRLTILDYHCDNTEVWRANKSFHGQNFIWCYLGNFGGNTILQGNPRQSEERLETAYAENGSNLTGIGSTLEGLDMQQMPYEVILDRAWALGERDVATETADRHAGHVSENIRAAWKVLYNEVYTEVSSSHGDLANFIPQMGKGGGMFRPINVNSEALLKATKLLLSDDKAPSDALKTDIIVSVRHLLNHKFQREKTAFDKSFEEKDIAAMRRHGTMMLELLADIDKITMFHPYSTMDKWVGLAREYGTTEHLKDYYEMNATRLVTTWGPNLNDYANRSLSGLISTYYTKRWEIYIDEAMNAVSKGLDFNSESNNKRQQELSESYRYTGGTNHIKPGDDLISTARLIVKKYF